MVTALAAVVLIGLMFIPIVNVAIGFVAGAVLGGPLGAIAGAMIGGGITAAWISYNSRATWPDRRGKF